MDPTPSPTGAHCAVHPEALADAVCARCGNFMCPACSEGGTRDACPRCRSLAGEVVGFTARRDRLTVDELVRFSWEAFKKQWLILSVIALIYIAILGAFGLVGQLVYAVGAAIDPAVGIVLNVASSFAQAIAQALLTGGFAVVLFDVMCGGQPDVVRLFSQFSRFRPYVVSTLILFAFALGFGAAAVAVFGIPGYYLFRDADEGTIAALVVAASVVAAIPALWVFLPFTFNEMEIALGGVESGAEAVRRSFALASGRRLWTLLVQVLAGLIGIAGLLLCCIGLVPAFALGQLLKLALYLALRDGSGLPALRPPPRA